ncbi:MAG: class I SAM-dependent methyltransferase [Bacteroidota bacterium]
MSNNAIFENERAINYDNFVNTWIPQYDFFMDMVTGMLTNIEMSPILIAGCGTGNEILSLLQSGIHGPITGVDPSPDMIAIARNKLKTYPQVNLVDGEVQVLPEGKVYSAATLILVLHFIKEDDAKLSSLWT